MREVVVGFPEGAGGTESAEHRSWTREVWASDIPRGVTPDAKGTTGRAGHAMRHLGVEEGCPGDARGSLTLLWSALPGTGTLAT
ncbi:unnamed protein product [Ilex paraguariensis]|uniref:Uncharacterized protein n=1 Tax=Ilex paraguariensis TaxID=185542 RepID=A0ABC8R9U0_9AQUA